MLKIDIEKVVRMKSGAAAILRGLQNTETEIIDLLIRESIQNSLDAGLSSKDTIVEFNVNSFSSNDFLSLLENTNKIKKMYEDNDRQQYIMISDMNTEGLTGPISYESKDINEKEGNLLKLVYNFGKNQTEAGSGGSFGYGKSIYYRVGIGIVLFYTRIKLDSGEYAERLVVNFLEDETKDETLLEYDGSNLTGVAWWGEYLPGNQHSSPITNSEKIHKILSIFGVKRYDGDVTGTRIIIPFIDEESIMDRIQSGPSSMKRNFYDDLSDYIMYSVQRWYAPRLNNKHYFYGKKNNLILYINGAKIGTNEQPLFFNIIREMYNYSQNPSISKLDKYIGNTEINKKDITINSPRNFGLSGSLLGSFVYININYRDLNMTSTHDYNNPTFLSNLMAGQDDRGETNKPIILYTRQPGMIVDYRNTGNWSIGNNDTPLAEYIIGFFVLNSSPSQKFIKYNNEEETLEEYIRTSEKSDHMEWFDSSFKDINNKNIDPRIVDKIRKNINSTITKDYFSRPKGESKPTNISEFISSLLGESILPEGLGNKASVKTTPSPRNQRPRTKKTFDSIIFYDNISFDINNIRIPYKIYINRDTKENIKFDLFIDSTRKKISISEFEKDMEFKSPLSIKQLVVYNDHFKVNVKSSDLFQTTMTYIIESDFDLIEKDDEIDGYIEITTTDRAFAPIIEINEVSKNE